MVELRHSIVTLELQAIALGMRGEQGLAGAQVQPELASILQLWAWHLSSAEASVEAT